MNDPRIILKEELINLGFTQIDAAIIALDSGSSQTIVNEEYLSDFKISKQQKVKVLDFVLKFYQGDLIQQD